MSDDKVPYVFDLLWDIKSKAKVYDILTNPDAVHCTSVNRTDLIYAMKEYGVPFPEGFEDPSENHEPYIWADSNGGYLTYAPDPAEAHNYRRYKMEAVNG